MNKELDTFLFVAKDLLAEKHLELTQMRQLKQELIELEGELEYDETLQAKTEFTGILIEFVLGRAMLINDGSSLADAMASLLQHADSSGDPFSKGITELCCEEILDRYLSLDKMLE